MEHIEVENKIKNIVDSLIPELKRLNAIDESGHATDEEAFNRVINEKINELNALEPLVSDESGVAKDRYAANIFFHNLELLNNMRKNKTVNFEPDLPEDNLGIEKENKPSKKNIFKNVMQKLLQKFSGRKKEIENVR